MATVLISGASGFIAQNAAARLKKAGFRTIGVSQRAQSLPHFDAIFAGALSQPLAGMLGEDIDAFIHCAYHSGRDDYALNVDGTRLWAEQADEAGVKQQDNSQNFSAPNR